MFNDVFENFEKELETLPQEIGTEAVAQAKGANDDTGSQQKPQDQKMSDDQRQKLLDDLYGSSSLTPEQVEAKKKQDMAIKRQNYQKIQQDIQEYRAKKAQELSKQEIGLQKGTEAARDKEEEMELWEKEQKKAEEKKKEREAITMPGSVQSRSGEQGKIMG
ncbi:MAG: hypothetical protein ACOX6V_00825 [Patescibacteria group bacterium]|jgi:hypothetical protein